MAVQAPEYRPLHIQIRDLLKQRIANREWGDRPLPPELVLAEEYNGSVGTMRRALDDLANHHLITRQRGKGTYVTRHSLNEALYRWFSIEHDHGSKTFPRDEVTKIEEAAAPSEEESRLLVVDPGGKVIRVHRCRFLNGDPVLRDVMIVDRSKFPSFAWPRSKEPTPYAYYEAAHQIKVIEVVEQVKAVAADEDDARVLGLDVGAPVLVIRRLALTFDDDPVELRISRLSTASYSYINRIV